MKDSALHVVTGAARGIGRCCAERLIPSGPLLLCDLNGDALTVTAKELEARGARVETVAGDLTKPEVREAIRARVEATGGLRTLVHAAGVSGTQAGSELILDLNLVASALLLRELLPLAQPGTAAVLLASQAGHVFRPFITPELTAHLADPLAEGFREKLRERDQRLRGPKSSQAMAAAASREVAEFYFEVGAVSPPPTQLSSAQFSPA